MFGRKIAELVTFVLAITSPGIGEASSLGLQQPFVRKPVMQQPILQQRTSFQLPVPQRAPVPSIPTPLMVPRPPPPPPPAFAAGPPDAMLAWPVEGTVISPFGPRRGRMHTGMDIKAPRGTVIGAAADGMVVGVGALRGYGKVVAVHHDNGLLTLYCHNERNLVTGGRVQRGQPIALVGTSGNASTPHVHFEVRHDGRRLDPGQFLRIRQLASLRD